MAKELLEGPVRDDRLSALLYAFLGRINDFDNNYEEAKRYFIAAVEQEKANNNIRNLILDYCLLLNCLLRINDHPLAKQYFFEFDSILQLHPETRLNNVYNSKALYYTYCTQELDSALLYGRKWSPAPVDGGAKAQLLSEIYYREGILDSAIFYEHRAYALRRPEDTLRYFAYFNRLSDLYTQQGIHDSAAFYAKEAFNSLHETYERKTEKRILELEKKYDLAAKDAELVKAQRSRDLALFLLGLTLLALALIIPIIWLNRKKVSLERQSELRSRVAYSLLKSVAATYAGVNKRLSIIHNLPSASRQEALGQFIAENQSNSSINLQNAIQDHFEELPETIQEVSSLLSGSQQKAVFILTELGFSPREISETLSIPDNMVRSVKASIRKKINATPLAQRTDVSQLATMQVNKRLQSTAIESHKTS